VKLKGPGSSEVEQLAVKVEKPGRKNLT